MIAPAAFGGAESVVRALAIGACQIGRGSSVINLSQGGNEGPLASQLREAGVSVFTVSCGRRRYRTEAKAVTKILEDAGADLAHTHVYHGDFVGYWAARRCGIPVVTTVHGSTGGDLKNRLYEYLDRRLLRRFDAVMCVSPQLHDRIIEAGCPRNKVHFIPNGHLPVAHISRNEARSVLRLSETGSVIGWIGRLSHEKGPDLVIDALGRLERDYTAAVLIGDGPCRPALEEQISGLAGASITLAGVRRDAARLLPAFDALVISSRTEGLPMVLLEAMAAEVPVVSFAVGGIPTVLDEKTGWLVGPGDVGGLATAIATALTNRGDALARAAAAKCLIHERFGIERWMEQIDEVYSAVLPR